MNEFTTVTKKEIAAIAKECEGGAEIFNNSESTICSFFEPGYSIGGNIKSLPKEFIGGYEVTDWEGYKGYFKNARNKFEGKRLLVLYHEFYTDYEEVYELGYERVDSHKLKESKGYDKVLILGISKDAECSFENAGEVLSEDLDDLKDFFLGKYKIFDAEELNEMYGKGRYQAGRYLVILYCLGLKMNMGKYILDAMEHKWGGKRDGAGRPSKNRTRMTLWLDDDIRSLLTDEAEQNGESLSDVANRLIKNAIK